MKVILTLGCLVAALGFAGQAWAARCVPPGNSSIVQYLDPLPGAGCDQAPGHGTTGPGGGSAPGPPGSAGAALRPAVARAFAARGSAGLAVAQLIAASGPAATNAAGSGTITGPGGPGAATKGAARAHGARSGVSLGRAQAQSLLAAAVSATTTSIDGGAGPSLVIFAAVALVAVLARMAWRRSRSDS